MPFTKLTLCFNDCGATLNSTLCRNSKCQFLFHCELCAHACKANGWLIFGAIILKIKIYQTWKQGMAFALLSLEADFPYRAVYLFIQYFCFAKEVLEQAQRPMSTKIVLNILLTSKLIIDRATLHFNDWNIKNELCYSIKIAKWRLLECVLITKCKNR